MGSTIPLQSIKRTYTFQPYLTEHKEKVHDIWRWKARSWLRTSSKCGRVKLHTRILVAAFKLYCHKVMFRFRLTNWLDNRVQLIKITCICMLYFLICLCVCDIQISDGIPWLLCVLSFNGTKNTSTSVNRHVNRRELALNSCCHNLCLNPIANILSK